MFCLSDQKSVRDWITTSLLFYIIVKSDISTTSSRHFPGSCMNRILLFGCINATEEKSCYYSTILTWVLTHLKHSSVAWCWNHSMIVEPTLWSKNSTKNIIQIIWNVLEIKEFLPDICLACSLLRYGVCHPYTILLRLPYLAPWNHIA